MMLSVGSSGDSVKFLQTSLNLVDTSGVPLIVDGKFGTLTKEKVIAYQKRKGLLVDGIVGPETQNSISNDLKKIPNSSAILTDPGFDSEKKGIGVVPLVLVAIGILFVIKKK